MRKLIIEDDEGGTSIVPLGETSVLLGRLEESTICLNERNISRRHAIIRKVDGRMMIETIVRPELPEPMRETIVWVNGKKISGQVPIEEGDIIRIGDFRISLSEDVEQIHRRPTMRFSRPTPGKTDYAPADYGSAETLRHDELAPRPEPSEENDRYPPVVDRIPEYMLLENIEPPTIEEVITIRLSRTRRLLYLAVVIAVGLAISLVVRAGCSGTKGAHSSVREPEYPVVLSSAAKLQKAGNFARNMLKVERQFR